MTVSPQTPRVYLDTCCLNRPFDDQTQERIRRETNALVRVFEHSARHEWAWISSTHVEGEIGQTRDLVRRRRVLQLVALAHENVPVTDATGRRALDLQSLGFSPADAVHIACAEQGRADVLLTTDESFIRRANRHARELQVAVQNPLTFVAAMEESDGTEDDN